MRKLLLVVGLAACLPPAMAQPVPRPYIYAVLDAAAYTPGIAPGSLFVLKGYLLPLSIGLKLSPLPLQERFNDVMVTLKPTGGGSPVNALIVYTYDSGRGDAEQIAAVLPSSVAPGIYETTVTVASAAIESRVTARVVARKYRSLANNQQGYGLAVIQNYVDAARLDRNMFATGTIGGLRKAPARPGQTVILWGLGLGGISKPDNQAPGVTDLRSSRDVRVAVGGRDAQVIYAGRAPEFPGVDQINFTLPADVPAGCNVPVEVIVDGSASNPVTMAIAEPGQDACVHPYLTRDQLERLDQGGKLLAGEFNMMVYTETAPSLPGQPLVEIHSAFGYFGAMTASRASTVSMDSIPLGRCVSWRTDLEAPGAYLDAMADDSADGGRLTLSGPGFSAVPLDGDDDWYQQLFSVRRVSDSSILAEQCPTRLQARRTHPARSGWIRRGRIRGKTTSTGIPELDQYGCHFIRRSERASRNCLDRRRRRRPRPHPRIVRRHRRWHSVRA